MGNVVAVVVVVLVAWYLIALVQRRRRGLVAERGLSIGADLGALSDQPRVRIQSMTVPEPGHVRLVLAAEENPDDESAHASPSDLDLVVSVREEDFGFDVLQDWTRAGKTLAMVVPAGSRIVRLRAIDDLQPLTLRRVEG